MIRCEVPAAEMAEMGVSANEGYLIFGVLIIRILLFRVPYFRKVPNGAAPSNNHSISPDSAPTPQLGETCSSLIFRLPHAAGSRLNGAIKAETIVVISSRSPHDLTTPSNHFSRGP